MAYIEKNNFKMKNFTNSFGEDNLLNSRERVIKIESKENDDKIEEYIDNLLFDLMYGIAQHEFDKVILKSQGKAINVCAQVVTCFEKRLKEQMIPIKRNITLNSKFLPPRNNRNNDSNGKGKSISHNHINILSYFDVVYYF